MNERQHIHPWRSVEKLIAIGYSRSRVVMMNEVHDGLLLCIRTRFIGKNILPTAHRLGVRHLALEAIYSLFAEEANRTRHLPEDDSGYMALG